MLLKLILPSETKLKLVSGMPNSAITSNRLNPLNAEFKTHMPFAGIVRSSPYYPRLAG